MKIYKLFTYTSIVILATLLFASCSDSDEKVNDITVDKESLNLLIGDRGLITVNGTPSNNVSSSDFEWTSMNEAIATVTKFGVVTGIEEGETEVVVKYGSFSKNIHIKVTDPIVVPDEVGVWLFEDAKNFLKAELGKDLKLGANAGNPSLNDFPYIDGPAGSAGAVRLNKGFHLIMEHGIAAKAGDVLVNEYTVMMDFRIPVLQNWVSFIQTNPNNDDDSEVFCKPDGTIGVGTTGYSATKAVIGGQWQRLILSYKLGENGWIEYFVDGASVLERTDMGKFPKDDRFAMAPLLLLGADDDGEDDTIDIARIVIWDKALDSDQARKANRVIGNKK